MKAIDYAMPALGLALSAAFFFLASSSIATLKDGTSLSSGTRVGLGAAGLLCLSSSVFWVAQKLIRHSQWRYLTNGNMSLMVKSGGYNVNEQQMLLTVGRAYADWALLYNTQKVIDNGVVWITMHRAPLWSYGRKVAGYVTMDTRDVHVAYKAVDQDLNATALAHEIGHIIQGESTGNWDEDTHHERSSGFGLR